MNTDDDAAGVVVTPVSGLVTTEAGGTATFSVRLATQPTANVTIALSSGDTTEGSVGPASLTFTPANWNTAQTVTVTGVDDANARDGVAVLHAATGTLDGELVATGGRVLSVVATGSDFAEARDRAYAGLHDITLPGGQFRTDIATKVVR